MKKFTLSQGAKKGIFIVNGLALAGTTFLTLIQLLTNGIAGEYQSEETMKMLDERYERKALPEKTEENQKKES